MLRPTLCTLSAAGLLAAAAPSALAATLTPDRSCHVSGGSMQLAGTGFAPGTDVTVASGRGGIFLQGPADPSGAFTARVGVPGGSLLGLQSTERTTLEVTATDAGGTVAKATVDVVQFAFKTNGGLKSTRAIRTWRFSGFQDTSRPIYGHFRFGGRTIANYRFGKPSGPCGLLTKRAPGIPARPRGGLWTIQIDQNKSFDPNEKVALKTQSFVQIRTVFR